LSTRSSDFGSRGGGWLSISRTYRPKRFRYVVISTAATVDMAYPVEVTCSQCGFSLSVSKKDGADVPDDLSPEAKARVVLEDHGWSTMGDRPLCDDCASA
jgi:hypothetical protein